MKNITLQICNINNQGGFNMVNGIFRVTIFYNEKCFLTDSCSFFPPKYNILRGSTFLINIKTNS